MQMPRDSFPTDWSPPPVEFLNKNRKVLQACRRLHEDWEEEAPDSDQKLGLTSLEELFWNMAGPSQQAVTPKVSYGGSECYVNNLDYLLQEKREQALEQEWKQLLQQEHPNLEPSECDEDYREAVLTPEHRMLVEKFSISLQVISPVHPGETVFLPRRQPLPCILDSSSLKPHSQLEELFLRSPLPQQLSFLHKGLLSNLYLHASDYPRPLLQWLFKLLTWPPETSSRAFSLLWDLSIDGLFRQPAKYHRLGDVETIDVYLAHSFGDWEVLSLKATSGQAHASVSRGQRNLSEGSSSQDDQPIPKNSFLVPSSPLKSPSLTLRL